MSLTACTMAIQNRVDDVVAAGTQFAAAISLRSRWPGTSVHATGPTTCGCGSRTIQRT